jgi:hypothetical protein
MQPASYTQQLTRAEGFFELGMFEEAWNETEELPPIDRTEPLVLELRLRILTALSQWELGESVAKILIPSPVEPDKCRETCARFHHARARYLCETGDNEAARLAMRAASDAWPEIRMELVDDE